MADPSLFDALRIPSSILIALDNREYHFAVQPWHYLLRMAHVISSSAFFGGIVLLDLRLIGVRSAVNLKNFSTDILPWLYVIFGVVAISGVLLFLYDPVHVGSHAYFMPKILLILLGLLNAALYNHFAYGQALTASKNMMPSSAKLAGSLSLGIWLGVMVFASLNVEGVPKLLLR